MLTFPHLHVLFLGLVLGLTGCATNAVTTAPTRGLQAATPAWERSLDGTPFGWTPVVVNDHVLMVGPDLANGEAGAPALLLQRVNVANGETLWETAIAASPGRVDVQLTDDVYVVRHDNALEGVRVGNGRYLWGIEYPDSPIAVGLSHGLMVAAFSDGMINARQLDTGQNRWTLQSDAWTVERIISDGDRLFGLASANDDGGVVAVFDLTKPHATPVWQAEIREAIAGIAADGHTMIATFEEGRRAVAIASGEPLPWTDDADDSHAGLNATPFANRLIASRTVDGLALRVQRVSAYDAATGDRVWDAVVPSGSEITDVRLDGLGNVIAFTSLSAVALDLESGATRWYTSWGDVAADGQRCTVLGSTATSVIRHCEGVTQRRISVEHVSP